MYSGKIYLVRHGQNEDNAELLLNGHRDRPLTEQGRVDAREVAKQLEGKRIQHVYSSPLIRSFETAEIISDALHFPKPIPNDLFIERDFGVLTGKPVADIPNYSDDLLQTEHILYFLTAEGAEAFPVLLERAKKGLSFIMKKHPDDVVLIVSHGDIGKMLKAAYYGKGWKEVLQDGYFSHQTVYELG